MKKKTRKLFLFRRPLLGVHRAGEPQAPAVNSICRFQFRPGATVRELSAHASAASVPRSLFGKNKKKSVALTTEQNPAVVTQRLPGLTGGPGGCLLQQQQTPPGPPVRPGGDRRREGSPYLIGRRCPRPSQSPSVGGTTQTDRQQPFK